MPPTLSSPRASELRASSRWGSLSPRRFSISSRRLFSARTASQGGGEGEGGGGGGGGVGGEGGEGEGGGGSEGGGGDGDGEGSGERGGSQLRPAHTHRRGCERVAAHAWAGRFEQCGAPATISSQLPHG